MLITKHRKKVYCLGDSAEASPRKGNNLNENLTEAPNIVGSTLQTVQNVKKRSDMKVEAKKHIAAYRQGSTGGGQGEP